MAVLTLRIPKGSPLTFEEADGNFKALNEAKAELDSPEFTGTPRAPTPESNSDSERLATTAFVKAQRQVWFPLDNDDVAEDAAIEGSKIFPDFGNQNVTTTGTISAGNGFNLAPGVNLWSPGDGQLAASTSGVTRWRISPAGNVGVGIEDPLELLHLAGNALATGDFITSAATGGLRNRVQTGLSYLSGGSSSGQGGNILCYGGDHPSLANEVRLRQGTEIRLRVTAAGAITLSAGGTNQNITLTPSGSGTVSAPTFNATSNVGGGFQGIGSDSASAPSFAFTNDLGTGMFRVAAGALGFALDGQEGLRLSRDGSTRQAYFPAAAVLGTTTGSLRLSPSGTLLLEPEGGGVVRSVVIYGTESAQPPNVYIASNGNLQRSTYSVKGEIDDLKARVSALESS